jgi:hypothetical protein
MVFMFDNGLQVEESRMNSDCGFEHTALLRRSVKPMIGIFEGDEEK